MERLYREYFPRLRALSQRTLGHLPGAGTEAEDVVQSALKSLCRFMRSKPQSGQQNRDDLWRILCHLVACKSRRRVTRQTRGLPGGRLHMTTDIEPSDGKHLLSTRLASVAPAEFDVCVSEALESLDSTLRQIALLTLEGYTQDEIAKQLGCSRRTIIRKLELIRRIITEMNSDEDCAPSDAD